MSPLLRVSETAKFGVTFGLLGQVGQLQVSSAPPAANGRMALVGQGSGSVLGLGAMDKKIETQFDPAHNDSHHFTITRVQGEVTTIDVAHQHVPGAVDTTRNRTGRNPHALKVSRPGPVLDPVGLLMRLRIDLPTKHESFEVLDGRALWRVMLTPAVAVTDAGEERWRIEGRMEPISFDGRLEVERPTRTFSVFFAKDPHHTPIRMEMPIGLGTVEISLLGVERGADPLLAAR